MGQGWKVGENEIGVLVEQLGDGNLIDKQPTDLTSAGKADGVLLDQIAKLKGQLEDMQSTVSQVQTDLQAVSQPPPPGSVIKA